MLLSLVLVLLVNSILWEFIWVISQIWGTNLEFRLKLLSCLGYGLFFFNSGFNVFPLTKKCDHFLS